MTLGDALKAVAWDIDGTLIDSEPLHHRALLAVCGSYGYDLSDLPEDTYRGVHMLDVWQDLSSRMPEGVEREEWLSAIIRYYAAHCDELGEMAGARHTMRRLHALRVRQVCVSNSPRRIVDANLEALGISDMIEFSVSIEDVRNGKPHSEPYTTAVEWLKLAPGEVLAIEDSASGWRAAQGAGLSVVGFGLSGMPEESGALCIETLSAVLDLFAHREGGSARAGDSSG